MGDFVNKVRKGLVKGPQQQGFTLDWWEKAFQALKNPDDSDKALFLSGEWFAAEFENARHSTSAAAKLVQCEKPLETILACATHQWWVVREKTWDAFVASRGKDFFPEELSELRIKNVVGVPIDPEVAMELLVDGARFPLAYKFPPFSAGKQLSGDVFKGLAILFILGGYYNTLEQWWLDCVWNDYRVIVNNAVATIEPCEWGTHRIQAISRFRQEARNHELVQHGINFWQHSLSDEVRQNILSRKPYLSAFKRHGKIRVKLATATRAKDHLKIASLPRAMIIHEYLEPFYRKPVGQFSNLNIIQILDAFELLSHLPDQIAQFLPAGKTITSVEEAMRYTAIMEYAELRIALQKAVGITLTQADWLMGFLTFPHTVREQLWFKPLIKLSSLTVALVVPAVDGINYVRLVDRLLKDIDNPEEEIGELFEKHVRAELIRSAKDFKHKEKLMVFPARLKFEVSPTEFEEIDLVYALGNAIYIGEDKAIIFPSEPLEKFHYIETLKVEAVGQAQRKATFVRKHLSQFLKLTKLDQIVDLAYPTVCPVVVTNSPFFSGFEVEGVPITDLFILTKYFRDGYLEKSAYIDASGNIVATAKEMFYEDEAGAIGNHESYLRKPPQLAAFEPYASLDDIEYVVPFGTPHCVHIKMYQMHLPYAEVREAIQKHQATAVSGDQQAKSCQPTPPNSSKSSGTTATSSAMTACCRPISMSSPPSDNC